MSRIPSTLLVLVTLVLVGANTGWAQDAPTSTQASAEDAIGQHIDKLRDAFNGSDVDALVALFLPTAELVDEAGTAHRGSAELAELFGGFFTEFPDATVRFDLESVRTITPQLAIGDLVRAISTPNGGERAISRCEMTFVSVDEKWLIAVARDTSADSELAPHEQLEPLAWIVGDWVDEGDESLIEIHGDWSEDGNYLLLDYRMSMRGEQTMTSRQRIGWDPVYEQVRSWVFDSDGGFGEGLWSRIGDAWVLKSTAVLPDGATGSATFIIEPEGDDRFVMHGLDRILGDEIEPDVEMTVVRRPPQSESSE